MTALAIKENVSGGEQWCAVCGGQMDSRFGPELFMEGTMQTVCRDCGRDFAPDLVQLLELSEHQSGLGCTH